MNIYTIVFLLLWGLPYEFRLLAQYGTVRTIMNDI